MSIAWTSGTEGVVRDVEEGIKFVRWIAGPGKKKKIGISLYARITGKDRLKSGERDLPRRSGSRISEGEKVSGDCWRELVREWERGGVGRLESGT